MLSTRFINRFTPVINTFNWLPGCLLVSIVLFTVSIQADGPATTKTDNIAALIQQLGVDVSSDTVVRGKLRALLAQKESLFAVNDPGDVQEGIWSGVIERVYVDNLDAQGDLVPGPTQFYLNTGVKHLEIFFLDEETGHAASGQRRAIRGYRSDRRVLVLESMQDQDDLLFDKPHRSNRR